MGSDSIKPRNVQSYCVSIHAPTWGATRNGVEINNDILVSIHAPTWGATQGTEGQELSCLFQSTLPHGERQLDEETVFNDERFNPRSHMGSD